MKKRIRAFLLAFVMLFTTVASTLGDVSVFKADQLVIKLHYNRPDGDYDNWSVWFWAPTGVAVQFAEENGEMVATYEVEAGATEVGYIVRLGEWEKKDIDKDQFIDVAAYTSGTLHVYVESGVEGHKVVEGDDVAMGTRVTSAAYNQDENQVEITVVNPKDGITENLVVKGKAGEVVITEVTGELKGIQGKYVIKLKEELQLGQKYQVAYDGAEYEITMPDYYSTEEFESKYTYTGNDLGSTWTKEATTFRLWAPTADSVNVKLYKSGSEANKAVLDTVEMKADINGTWVAKVDGDLHGAYYTYEVFKLQMLLTLGKTLVFRAICPTVVLIVSYLAD